MKPKSVCSWLKRIHASQAWLHPAIQAKEADPIEQIILSITNLHGNLVREPDLRPCCHINRLFEELVSLCTQTLGPSSISKVRLPPSTDSHNF
jgi:hypothetical protein